MRNFAYGIIGALTMVMWAGSSAQAISVAQSETVLYALTKIEDTTTHQLATAASTEVQLYFSVSIPRTSTAYGMPSYAMPARLMVRPHKGPSTVFDGSITLTCVYPTTTTGSASYKNFYPMPQKGTTVNTFAVTSGATSNVNGDLLTSYVADGTARDPARWEKVYRSAPITVAESPLVQSLLQGEATYEWYVASSYGLGSFARISDIQDAGRKPAFSDLRCWTGTVGTDVIDKSSQVLLGEATQYTMTSMAASGTTWTIQRGTIGVNVNGVKGAQLLNVVGTDANYNDFPVITSPFFEDGVSAITFTAVSTGSQVSSSEYPLLVQYQDTNSSGWKTLEELNISTSEQSYTVTVPETLDALGPGTSAQIRIVRSAALTGAYEAAAAATYVIKDVRVRSATPSAVFSAPDFSPLYPEANSDYTFKVTATAAKALVPPRNYAMNISVSCRADNLGGGQYVATLDQSNFNDTTGAATLGFKFTKGSLHVDDTTGALNVRENAFFTDVNGVLTGMLPGVYDVTLQGKIEGSFLAGRDNIDEREAASMTVATYQEKVDEVYQNKPYIIDLREQETAHEAVKLHVMYRTYDPSDGVRQNVLKDEVLACEPSPNEPNLWRVALPRRLKITDASDATYVWGYENSSDAKTLYSFVENMIAFSIEMAGTTTTWMGQSTTVSAGTLPPTTEIVPAVRLTGKAVDSQVKAVPFIVPLNSFQNTHAFIEVDLSVPTSPTVKICGAYDQTFNTWYAPSVDFTKSDYREDVTAYPTDFNCTTITNSNGSVSVYTGWKPDEGPLADASSFTESFIVGRGTQTGYSLFYGGLTGTADGTHHFATWGAAENRAKISYLKNDDTTDLSTEYMRIDGSGAAQVVLTRNWQVINASDGTSYQPDAQIKLTSLSGDIQPRYDSNAPVILRGAGTVHFTMGISLPYDINQRAELMLLNASGYDRTTRGLSAGVTFASRASQTAASGYSVSYYLRNVNTGAIYELRLTQALDFPKVQSTRPEEVFYAEIFTWSGNTCTRLNVYNSATSTTEVGYVVGPVSQLVNLTAAFWMQSDGRLAAGFATGSASGTVSAVSLRTAKAVVTNTSSLELFPALGSAECRPIFRNVSVTKSLGATNWATLTTAQIESLQNVPWTLATDATNTSRVQLTRQAPSAETEGKVKIRAITEGGTVVREFSATTSSTNEQKSFTIGKTNVTLSFFAAEGSNVFLDNIYCSSWCGNDESRNGDDNVPRYTAQGYGSNTGYAGVGLWVMPTTDAQKTVEPTEYDGQQSLLLQRSRKNTLSTLQVSGSSEVTLDGIRTTANSLALYLPYSTNGYGNISFKYKIPTLNEFSDSTLLNTSVSVMLQYNPKPQSYRNYLTEPRAGWVNASPVISLSVTGEEWMTANLTPRYNDAEIAAQSGTLRLVMVTTGLADTDDPYVYIDDFVMTDNNGSVSDSWSAQNAKFTTSPVSLLYWKDRLPSTTSTLEQADFKNYSQLTQAVQLNNLTTSADSDSVYNVTVLDSPFLANGAGRVTFAARKTETQASKVRIYISASTAPEGATNKAYSVVTYVDVDSTVFQVFDVDLASFSKYLSRPDKSAQGTQDFDFSAVTYVRLQVYAADDSNEDPFGDVKQTGRVLLDRMTICNPVTASLRVKEVAFSNVAGSAQEGFDTDLGRNSPLSQPVAGTTALRTRVVLDNMNLLKQESVRVFFTYRAHVAGNAGAKLKLYSSGYDYTDVLGNVMSATTDTPVYAWDKDQRAEWPVSAWFDSADAFNKVKAGTLPANTVELTAVNGMNYSVFTGDLSKTTLVELPANALVQYIAWAVYQDEAGERMFFSRLQPGVYTDFPWYFPRNLNTEVSALDAEAATSDCFSPYYWVYSCLPGEVFINEVNLKDASSVPTDVNEAPFVEICAPTDVQMKGWQTFLTGSTSTTFDGGFAIASDVKLTLPDNGVVPARGEKSTNASRSFYTSFGSTRFFYTQNGTPTSDQTGTYKNAGAADGAFVLQNTFPSVARSVVLMRPTGGTDHIVVYTNLSKSGTSSSAKENVQILFNTYATAMTNGGFFGQWYQAFYEDNWADESVIADFTKKVPLVQSVDSTAHTRRLVMAYDDNVNADNAFITDEAAVGFANSISTVDMGGLWTTRQNTITMATDTCRSPIDLTEIMTGDWTGDYSPFDQARLGDSTKSIQVTPRQLNLSQYLFRYTALAQTTVASTVTGLGSHRLTELSETGTDATVRSGDRLTAPYIWSIGNTVKSVRLTYTPALYHTVGAATLTLFDSKTGVALVPNASSGLTEAMICNAVTDTQGKPLGSYDATTGVFTFAPQTTALEIVITLAPNTADESMRVNVVASATYELAKDAANAVITHVTPYCGETFSASAKYQPWWGSSFGFEVTYDTSVEGASKLVGTLITYPQPGTVYEMNVDASWTGTGTFDGISDEAAQELLSTTLQTTTRYARIDGAMNGRIANAGVVGALAEAYSSTTNKEPAIPFCVWGIYKDTLESPTGVETVTFLMRQAKPSEKTGLFTYPAWYAPVADSTAGAVPYFYLYSTPPESAWINEINAVSGPTGSEPYVEFIFPRLREGMTKAGIPETTASGWSLNWYQGTTGETLGNFALGTLDLTTISRSGAYSISVMEHAVPTNLATGAAVLMRPCGAAEGGVWTGVTATSGTVAKPTSLATNAWLLNETYPYVFAGVSDATGVDGSVQLVGIKQGDLSAATISDEVALRSEWAFAAESKKEDNSGVRPNPSPIWNAVTVTSSLFNTIYPGAIAGYQIAGLFGSATGSTTTLTETHSGSDWIYPANARMISYRPQTGYLFASFKMNADLIGKVMLIGNTTPLTEEELSVRYQSLALADASTWLTLNGVGTVDEATGTVTFDPTVSVGAVPFGELETYYITVVFVQEPASASNTLTMNFGQGEVKAGAWLHTQTLFAQSDDKGTPDLTQGGDTVTAPIWTDADGNDEGHYGNRHGWVYQPVVGDNVGMSAVILPEEGLNAIDRTRLVAENTSVRPFLIWNLIPASKVKFPETTSDQNEFLRNWDMSNWLGTTPTSMNFRTFRTNYKSILDNTGNFYTKGGILPMKFTMAQNNDLENGALAFATMTKAELEDALAQSGTGLTNSDDLQPYEWRIAMQNEGQATDWSDGAVLRFAIVIADATTGVVYDWQAISNFKSDALPVYCPWYVPNSKANINAIAANAEAGISPYAWIYQIPKGGAWINEMRPFATDAASSAIELGLTASPLNTLGYPIYSLAGWRVVTNVAPLPFLDAEEAITWNVQNEIDLNGWVPLSRFTGKQDTTEGLDYYMVTEDPTKGLANAQNTFNWIAYSDASQTTFNYLSLTKPLLTPLTFDPTDQTYGSGIVYAVQLFRPNGVMEDEVLFYHERNSNSDNGVSAWTRRMALACTLESAANKCANIIRSMDTFNLPQGAASAYLYVPSPYETYKSQPETFLWTAKVNGSGFNTFPGANYTDVSNDDTYYGQVNSAYTPVVLTYYTLTAQRLGLNDASLSIFYQTTTNAIEKTTTSEAIELPQGGDATVQYSGWNNAWFEITSLKRNDQSLDLEDNLGVTEENQKGTMVATTQLSLTETNIAENVDYVVTFSLTQEAQALADDFMKDAPLSNEFIEWLTTADPLAVEDTSLSATEKYWVGVASPASDATEVQLSATAVGTDLSQQQHAVSFRLSNGDTLITSLRGDAQILLYGKDSLSETRWTPLYILPISALNGASPILLNTDKNFFKAVLVSKETAAAAGVSTK